MNYLLRRQNLKSQLEEDVIILFSGFEMKKSADEAYPFEVDKNFYYLTGINQKNCYLVLRKNGVDTLYVDELDEKLARWIGAPLSFEEVKNISSIEEVKSNNEIDQVLEELGKSFSLIGLDLVKADFLGSISYGEMIQNKLKVESSKVSNIAELIYKMRMVKDEDEIAELKEAISLTHQALNKVLKNIKPCTKEKEVQCLFENEVFVNDHTLSFATIAAAGKNATTLHYSKNNESFDDKDMILLDLGARHNFYCADISRTYPHHIYSPLQREIYEIVLYANKKIISIAKPGLTIKDLQEMTKTILADGLMELKIIKTPEELDKYYFHGVSHHLGLDTHDEAVYSLPLQAGNVITVEPGLYIPEYNIGVRIEDDVLITEEGSICLSSEIEKEISDILKLIHE